jgi:hypothetical protein
MILAGFRGGDNASKSPSAGRPSVNFRHSLLATKLPGRCNMSRSGARPITNILMAGPKAFAFFLG